MDHIQLDIVGADYVEASKPLLAFKSLIQLFRNETTLKKLTLRLVGPNVSSNSSRSFDFSENFTVKVVQELNLYHESSCPCGDASFLFNAGIWGYDSWIPTLEYIFKKGIPVIITSYNEFEADDDFDTLNEALYPKQWVVLKAPESNPYRSDASRDSGIEGRQCVENSYWMIIAGSQDPFQLDLKDFQSRLEHEALVVWKNATGIWGDAILEEIDMLMDLEKLDASKNRLPVKRDKDGSIIEGHLLAKHAVFEHSLVVDGKQVSNTLEFCPNIQSFVDTHGPALVMRLNQAYPGLALQGVDTLKVQVNDGGAFHMHYDTKTSISNRAITALLYLNPDYKSGQDGGELELFPFPLEPVLVEPAHDTFALFCSTETLHRVRTSRAKRRALAIWFSSEKPDELFFPSIVPPILNIDYSEEEIRQLKLLVSSRQSRRLLAKVKYRSHYHQSYFDAFGSSQIVKDAVALDHQETDKAEALLPKIVLRYLGF